MKKSFIDLLRESKNKVLNAEADAIDTWGKMRHNKDDLQTFLNWNIAEIGFTKKDGTYRKLVCTSNTTLLHVFSIAKRKDKEKAAKVVSEGIKTDFPDTVLTFDLIANSFKTIQVEDFEILNFVTIKQDNILLLDQIVRELLFKRSNK